MLHAPCSICGRCSQTILAQAAGFIPWRPGYAVMATQWLLTALFAVIYDVRRAFQPDDVRDIGFAPVTGRPRPLSHSTFQHLLGGIPAPSARQFYDALGGWDAPHRWGMGCRPCRSLNTTWLCRCKSQV